MQFIDVLPKQSNGVIADGPAQIDHWDVIVYGVDTFVNLTRPLADSIIDQYPGAIVRDGLGKRMSLYDFIAEVISPNDVETVTLADIGKLRLGGALDVLRKTTGDVA